MTTKAEAANRVCELIHPRNQNAWWDLPLKDAVKTGNLAQAIETWDALPDAPNMPIHQDECVECGDLANQRDRLAEQLKDTELLRDYYRAALGNFVGADGVDKYMIACIGESLWNTLKQR